MITIFYGTDNHMFTQQVMSLITLARTTSEPLNVINLTVEVPEYLKSSKKTSPEQDAYLDKILKDKNPESKWTSIDVSDLFREKLLKGPNIHNKYYNMFVTVRMLAHLVPELGDKAIWLDSDILINKDIKELWDMDVTDYEWIGRRDDLRISRYLQTGVMLLNLKAIRESGSFDRALENVTTKKRICYIDMSALNECIPSSKKKVFDKKYNTYKYSDDCVIFHACSVREGHILFTKKWWHRIKPDELDLFGKFVPAFQPLVDEMKERIEKNPELFAG